MLKSEWRKTHKNRGETPSRTNLNLTPFLIFFPLFLLFACPFSCLRLEERRPHNHRNADVRELAEERSIWGLEMAFKYA